MDSQPLPLTDQAARMIAQSKLLAMQHTTEPGGIHWLMSIPENPLTVSKRILDELGIDIDRFHEVIEKTIEQSATQSRGSLDTIIDQASLSSNAQKWRFISDEHLFVATLELGEPDVRLAFERLGVPLETALERAQKLICKLTEQTPIMTGDAKRLNPVIQIIEKGRRFMLKRQFDLAISTLSEAIQVLPTSATAHLWRAITYREKGDPDSAIADFNEASRLNPQIATARFHVMRGLAHAQKGDSITAINDFDKAIQLDNRCAIAFFVRGAANIRNGHLDNAIRDFDELLRLEPINAAAYQNRGLAYQKKGEEAKAEADFAMAMKLGYNK